MNTQPEQKYEQNNAVPSGSGKKAFVRTVAVVLTCVFCILTAGLGLYGLVSSDREFSESENRVLASEPVFTWTSLFNGSFMKDVETYLSDQFPFRDAAIELKTFSDRLMGKREENGVYIGKDNYLFDSQTDYIKKQQTGKIKAINAFSENCNISNQLFVLSPNSSYIYREKLPYGIKLSDQSVQIDKIYSALKSDKLNKIDAVSVLEKAKSDDIQLFYRTDHHWTTAAAYNVFKSIAKEWKLNTDDVEYYFYPVTYEFEGTLSGKSGVHDVKDIIEICVPKNSKGTFVVNFESQQKKTVSLFDESKLMQKNKYEVFLGGNFDKVIVTTTVDTDNTLLIVKDSFANCMLPMFTPYFSKIVIVDPRYMTESIYKTVSETDFTHILFLYNLNTFNEDTSIISVFSDNK